MPSILRKGIINGNVCFIVCIVMLYLGLTRGAWAELNDVAIYRPAVQGGMSIDDQKKSANYIYGNISPASKEKFVGYDQTTVDFLTGWMDSHMNDGRSDVLIIIDIIPAALFQGESDGSPAEQWMDNGNMLLWTGSEPFAFYINTSGAVSDVGAGADGAGKVLDVSSSGLCRGGGLQKGTSAVFNRYYDETDVIRTDPDGDYNIGAFVEYTAGNAMKYDQLLIDALDSDRHTMSNWKIDEVFAEDSEAYQSDNIVLVNADNGQFAQFYTTTDLNDARQRVITQVLNNWAALPGNTLIVDDDFVDPGPNEFATIQAAIDAAQPRDAIVVKPGAYNEQLDLKTNTLLGTRGVKIVSDDSEGGGEFLDPANPGDITLINENIDICASDLDTAVRDQWKQEWSDGRPGYAEDYASAYGIAVESKKVLRRAARTIIYGTGGDPKPMVDFALGSTVGTILDGFTICAMPTVDHTIPGHAHVVQTRGGSATVVNNIVYNNGSSGLGSHAWFYDQKAPDINTRDFRYDNIMHEAHPILINNVVFRNEGNNLGNNHYSYAIMFNNELFESISIANHESPGIGCQHGAHPLIDGNLVYKSDWVGIGCRKGEVQGAYPINRPTHPRMSNNMVFDAGENDTSGSKPPGYPFPGEHGAGIGADDTGGWDPKTNTFKYHIIENNYVNGAKNAAIGARSTDPALGYVMIINNEATGGGAGAVGAGIGINGAYAAEISGNITCGNGDAGIGIRGGGGADLIANNESCDNGMAGIGLKEGAEVNTITGNNIHDNVMAGIGHDGSEGRVTVALEAENIVRKNGAAGIGMINSTVSLISNNTIAYNVAPGITVTSGSTAASIDDNTLTGNGTGGTTGMSIIDGSAAVTNNVITGGGTTNITITGSGSYAVLEGNTITSSGTTGLKIADGAVIASFNANTISDSGAAGINIDNPGSDTITLSNSTIEYNGTAGLTSADCNLILANSNVDNNGTAGINMSGGTLDLSGGSVSQNGTLGISNDGNTTVSAGTVDNNGTVGVSMIGAVHLSITGISSVSGNGTVGVACAGVGNTVYIRDSLFNANGTLGISLGNGNLDIDGGAINDNGHWGLSLTNTVGSVINSNFTGNGWGGGGHAVLTNWSGAIQGNDFIGAGGQRGLAVSGAASNPLIDDNDFSYNFLNITVDQGASATITDNRINACHLGVMAGGSAGDARDVIISGNHFDANFKAISFESAVTGEISENYFRNTGYDVQLFGGVTALIRDNEFVTYPGDGSIPIQVWDNTTADIADNSFDVGGLPTIMVSGPNASARIRGNTITRGRGLQVDNGAYALVHNNLVAYFDTRKELRMGFRFFSGADAEVYNNTFTGARLFSSQGIEAQDGATVVARNNLITGVVRGIRNIGGTATVDVSHNNIYDVTIPYENIPDPGPGSMAVDPAFEADFSLQCSSPCIDAGTVIVVEGEELPYTYDAPDMGAFEFSGAPCMTCSDITGESLCNAAPACNWIDPDQVCVNN